MSSKTLPALVVAFSILVAGQGDASAQTVDFQVQEVAEVALSGAVSLTINDSTPGVGLINATSNNTYSITSNGASKKIQGALNTAMPSNVTLKLNLAAPSTGASSGTQTLTTTPVDLVTSIEPVNQAGLSAVFTLEATVAAGVVAPANRILTLTVISE